ncbi:hypothetical protein [Pseudoduganella umbonata]|uniref:Uncharacterized protein n=1 Tax=Pseudoduganella umbonata TaxID=864828 RepID=A0A4P8HPT7_9BURK|nr:hypothetical protein [Pseudoduganella umbonata]MBB3220776.1 hypothetical protein [Pseudoduganella umbonata]QCP11753.1 hypothetical protein FCL38_15980 [Pseudoduganella umbonata]
MTPAAVLCRPSRAAGLGVAAGLHAAVIALLLADAARPPTLPAGQARAFLLVPLRTQRPAEPPPAGARQDRAPARQRHAAARPPIISPLPPALPSLAGAITLPPAAPVAPVAPVAPAAPADPFAEPAAQPSLAERARSSAGKIARELAQEPGQRPQGPLAARRNRHFDRPYESGMHGFTEDRYVSPDGTSVIRRKSSGEVSCHMPAPYQLRAIPRSSSSERRINCPPDNAGWERH